MTTYALSSRFWNLFWLVASLIPVIALGSRLLALGVSGRLGEEPTSGLFLIAFGSIFFVLGSVVMAWQVHEVRISGNGMIEIARALSTTGFDAREVRQLEGRHHRGYDNEQEWKLHITWASGMATVDEFHNVREFADRIEALNPTVKITGIWPMGAPEPVSRAGRVRS
jgi:hypothetical protein